MNSMPRIFFSKPSPGAEPRVVLPFLRESLRLLFPNAVPVEAPEPELRTSQSFFLREGENLLWFEAVFVPFSRDALPDYLARLRRTQGTFLSGVFGILAAPHFEAGVLELLELMRIPVRAFRYQLGTSEDRQPPLPQNEILWMEELTSLSSKNLFFTASSSQELVPGGSLPEELPATWHRLTREELREFIQLELDVASHK